MRISYIVLEDLFTESGVSKKINEQIRYWISAGHEVKLHSITWSNKLWKGFSGINVEVMPGNVGSRKDKFILNYLNRKWLVNHIDQWNPDIIYLRFGLYRSWIWAILKKYSTVIEINSNDISEYELTLKKNDFKSYLYHVLTRRKFLSKAKGFVFVSNELAILYNVKKPYVVISNGIDTSKFQSLPAPKNKNPRLFFIATPLQTFRGVDKIIFLAKHFPDWHFDIVGHSEKDLCETPPQNVHLHGMLTYEDYLPIMKKADIGIGTLALHRISMNEACPLKVREYLAFGIPTIIGYKDTDFPNGAPFILQLPNTPTNVVENFESIEKFVMSWKGKRVERKDIAHIDVAVKEKKRLEFFQSIIQT